MIERIFRLLSVKMVEMTWHGATFCKQACHFWVCLKYRKSGGA